MKNRNVPIFLLVAMVAGAAWAAEPTPETPWQTNAYGTLVTNIAWNHAMGYHFTPLADGQVTQVGGFFDGAKTVRLFNKATGAVLASATVTANNTWAYAPIAPVPVTLGTPYTVAVYLAGSGGSYRALPFPLPLVAGHVRIEASSLASTATNPAARPTIPHTTTMYGQADLLFVPGLPGNQTPIANAGAAQTVPGGGSVTLDARASRDPEGQPLTYQWSQTAGPAVTLAHPTSATPSFTAPASDLLEQKLVFQVLVSDGLLRALAWATVMVDKVPTAPQTPWATNATGTLTLNVAWHYALGYHFTPLADGTITHLGGLFNGTKIVKLFNRTTGAVLASATVTAANGWAYAPITPVAVTKNAAYTVAVYLAGSGGSYHSLLTPLFPRTFQDVRIDGTTYAATSTDPNARPTTLVTSYMYGQADIGFLPGPPNQPPVLSPIGHQTVDEGQLLSLTLAATDPEGNALTFSASGLPSGATFTPATRLFSWTPDFTQSGSYPVTFSVSDGIAPSVSEAVTITVADINRPPVLTPIGPQSVNESELLTFQVSGSDPDGDALTYSADALPSGASFDPPTRTCSWTPAFDQAGSYPATFSVSDGIAPAVAETITITVTDVNRPPIANAGTDQTVAGGSLVTLDGTGSNDPDGQPLSYQWTQTNGPTVTLSSPTTVAPTFTAPRPLADTGVTFQLTVSDGDLSASAAVTVTVQGDRVPPTGAVTINGGAAGTNNVNITLTLAATDDLGAVAQMQCSNDGMTYSTPEPYATTKTWTLATGDGAKTVSVKFSDPAGNWSDPVSATITLDTTPPSLMILAPADGAIITAPTP